MAANVCWSPPLTPEPTALPRRRDPLAVISSGYAGSAVDARRFTVQIGLGRVAARRDQIQAEIGDQLDGYGVATRQDQDGQLILAMTVDAADLWVSILVAMAAVTSVGYVPQSVEARPAPSA